MTQTSVVVVFVVDFEPIQLPILCEPPAIEKRQTRKTNISTGWADACREITNLPILCVFVPGKWKYPSPARVYYGDDDDGNRVNTTLNMAIFFSFEIAFAACQRLLCYGMQFYLPATLFLY